MLEMFMESNSAGDRSNNLLSELSELSDAELFTKLRTGHNQALGILYDRYNRLVYSLALRILTNPQEAEDLTQEIFLTLWQRNTYNPVRGSLTSFLGTLTRSRAIDKLRSRNVLSRLVQRWGQIVKTESPVPSPIEAADLDQRSHLVQAALLELPEQQRQVLELSYYGGLSQSEIAKQLNIPLGTIKTWSRQGLLKLRHNLQDSIG
jgi:RNA polymerase sigma-70 factor, ECF subfamily